MRSTPVALILAVAAACTGEFGDSSGADDVPEAASRSSEGGALDASGESSCVMDDCGPAVSTGKGGGDDAEISPDSGSLPDSGSEPSGACGTSMDSYGYTRCACSPGPSAPVANALAKCVGYDCCVRYAGDSGLAEGFGNPTLSSNLCACFSSADIAAVLGVTTTCQDFARGSAGTVTSSCP